MSTRVAIITGAAQGIGEAIAIRLAHDGFDIAILDVRGKEGQLEAVAQKVKDAGRRAHWMVGDVSNEASVKESVESVVENLGGVDVVS
jgi:NAD(P)-dependent dehydrogenase (short-subunit alcohol dehydrogenase family)